MRRHRWVVAACMMSIASGLTFGEAGAQAGTGPSPFVQGARVAVNADGQAVVAWAGPRGVRAVVGDRLHGLGAPAPLSSSPDVDAPPLVAIDGSGAALVVWETTRTVTHGRDTDRLSTGVWAALRPAGGAFGAPVALAGPVVDHGGSWLAEPRLAMSVTGEAIVAWSGPAGAAIARRAAGATLGASQHVAPPGFTVNSVAVGGHGEAFLGDEKGRLVVRPPGGAFGAPQPLPGATAYAPVKVAANARGDAIAAYATGASSLSVVRRPAGGDVEAPLSIAGTGNGGAQAIAIADDGEAVVTWMKGGDYLKGQHTTLYTAVLRPAAKSVVQGVNAPGDEVSTSLDGNGLDMSASGDIAVGWQRYDASDYLFGRRLAQVAVRLRGGIFGAPYTLTADAAEHPIDDAPDVAINARGELLATWVDQHPARLDRRPASSRLGSPGEAHLNARWFAADGASAITTLDIAPALALTRPLPERGHFARVELQPAVTPTRRGRIPVGLTCVSHDRRACNGVLTLAAGPHAPRAGRRRFALAPFRRTRVFVTLNRRTRTQLRRRRHLTLVATAVTRRPNGANGRRSGAVYVNARTAASR